MLEGALAKAEKTEAELRYLADHDPLTGLLNRRSFRAKLDRYVSFSARYGGRGRRWSSTSTASRRSTTGSATSPATP